MLNKLSRFEGQSNSKTASVVLPDEDSRCAAILRQVVKNLKAQGQEGKTASILSTKRINEVAELRRYLSLYKNV